MSKLICIAAVIMSSMMMLHLMFRNVRNNEFADRKTKGLYLFLTLNSALAFTWIPAGGPLCFCASAGLWMTLCVLFILESPSLPSEYTFNISCMILTFQTLLILCNILHSLGVGSAYRVRLFLTVHMLDAVVCVLLYVFSQWCRIRDVKALLNSGSAWNNLESSVHSVYAVTLVLYPVITLYAYEISSGNDVLCMFALLLELGMMWAFCFRISADARLVFLQRHETLILESMKVSQIEMSSAGNTDVYRELYDRLVAYFEEEKPYLNSKLTINDVIRKVYSNRVYISRAISQCTGRNFCQFVNYYRISYAVECFRKDPDLKVSELSEKSGFNSPVTFNVAFHLFMNDNPSDWLRKEKAKILNKKK